MLCAVDLPGLPDISNADDQHECPRELFQCTECYGELECSRLATTLDASVQASNLDEAVAVAVSADKEQGCKHNEHEGGDVISIELRPMVWSFTQCSEACVKEIEPKQWPDKKVAQCVDDVVASDSIAATGDLDDCVNEGYWLNRDDADCHSVHMPCYLFALLSEVY